MLERAAVQGKRSGQAARDQESAGREAETNFPSLTSEPATMPQLPGPEAIAARIAAWERELRARGGDAGLHHEVGRLWEYWQRSPRNAAIAYQNAYRHDRTHLPTLRDARRLFASVGNWQMVAQLLEAEAEAARDDRRRAALLFERGFVLEERLGRAEAAHELYRRALELDPACLPALLHLASLQAADAEALARTLEAIAGAADDERLRARALATAASLYDDRLRAPDEAARVWGQAFAAAPDDRAVSRRFANHLRRLGRDEELVAVHRAEMRDGGPEGAAAAYALARLYLRRGRGDDALAALLEARELAPRDPLVLGELARIYEDNRAWPELAGVLEASVEAAGDEGERIAVHLALGALYDERLDRRDAAIESYTAILNIAPHHGSALAALGRLYHQAGDWEGLLATFEAEAAAADDPRQRASRLYKAALLLEERLGRADEAIARHEATLQLIPGYLPSMQALARLFSARGRWAELVALLEQDLKSTTDRDQTLDALGRIASIQERHLGDCEAAIASHRRMLEIAPDHLPTIRELARLGEEAGAWEELIFALEREAARTGDQRHVISLLHRIAEIVEERIGDRDRAAACWERLLTLAPAYLPALRAMGRICARQGRWEELVAMHRREAQATADRRAAAAILCRVGELCEQELCDEERALAAWREVLRLDPAHFPALQRLARIHRARADWDALVEVLREEAAARTRPAERATVFCRIAEIQEEQLHRPEAALGSWQEALRLQPDHVPALQALERLYESAGSSREVADIYELQLRSGAPPRRAAAWTRLAALYLDSLGEPSRAAQCCEAALALAPDHLGALHLLERVRSLQGDRHRRADIRSRLAASLTGPSVRAALLLAANADRERVEGAPALPELQEAMQLAPDDERAFEALERALARTGDAAALADALELRAERERDPASRGALLHRLAEIRARDLRDPQQAAAALAAALTVDASNLPVLVDQARLLEAAAEWPALRQNLRAQGGALRDPNLAVEAHLRAADISERFLADSAGAQIDLRAILARDPGHPVAQRRLEEIVAASGGVAELVRLHEQRAAAATISTDVAEAWVAAARLRHEKMGESEAALVAIERALAAVPAHREALERRGRIHRELGQWEQAAKAFAARAQLGGEGVAAAHFQLGLLYAEHLGDTDRAVFHLQAAVEADPGQVDALRLLVRLQLAARNHGGALEALRRLAAVEHDPKAAAAVQADLARVHEEGFGDLAAAAAACERLLELEPNRLHAWEQLAGLYERVRDLPRLVSALERWAAREKPARAAALLARAGTIYAVPLHQNATALERWRQAVAIHPGCRDAHIALAEHGGADAIGHHLWLLEADPLRLASRQALLDHWIDQGESDRAYHSAAVLHLLGRLTGEPLRWYEEHRRTLGQLHTLPAAVRAAVVPPIAKGPLAELATGIGSELGRIVPPRLERWKVGRSDALAPEDPLRVEFETLLLGLGGDPSTCEILASPVRLALAIEATEPPSAILGRDLLTRAVPRERRFLLARIAWQLVQQNAFLHQLPVAESAAILGAAVQLHERDFEGLGPIDPADLKRVSRGLPRRVRKGIERSAREVAMQPAPWDAAGFVDGVRHAADRIGLLLGADTEMALALLLRDEAPALELDDRTAVQEAIAGSKRAQALLRWATGDEHLSLRRQLGTAVG